MIREEKDVWESLIIKVDANFVSKNVDSGTGGGGDKMEDPKNVPFSTLLKPLQHSNDGHLFYN